MIQLTLDSQNRLESNAIFSPDKKYRYVLWRTWSQKKPVLMYVGLNPSTADDKMDDPTITRCIHFAKDWGYGKIIMVNLFAFRSTDPKALKSINDPIGPENDNWIKKCGSEASLIIPCWGNPGTLFHRSSAIWQILPIEKVKVFGFTEKKEPKHPLYLKKDCSLISISKSDLESC